MADNSIPKQVLQQLKQIGTETVEKGVEEIGKMGEKVITGKELLGIDPMTAGEYQKKQQDDDKSRQEEINKLTGRNVEQEVKEVRDEKEKKEREEEEAMLENVKRQREEEDAERAAMVQIPVNSKREAAKRQGQPGRKKSAQPDLSQMSQTSEFKGKID